MSKLIQLVSNPDLDIHNMTIEQVDENIQKFLNVFHYYRKDLRKEGRKIARINFDRLCSRRIRLSEN